MITDNTFSIGVNQAWWDAVVPAHLASFVFDDEVAGLSETAGFPGPLVPYFERGPHAFPGHPDYAQPDFVPSTDGIVNFQHGLGSVVTALIEAGLTLHWLHEHPEIPWPMFQCLTSNERGAYSWPNKPWLPLSFSLCAEKKSP